MTKIFLVVVQVVEAILSLFDKGKWSYMLFRIEKREYFKLNKTERNGHIIVYINSLMHERGYEERLIFQPVENGYQGWGKEYPPAKNGIPVFAKFIWQLNGDEQFDMLEVECSNLIGAAARHYGLS